MKNKKQKKFPIVYDASTLFLKNFHETLSANGYLLQKPYLKDVLTEEADNVSMMSKGQSESSTSEGDFMSAWYHFLVLQ
jgi:hypothetical protein